MILRILIAILLLASPVFSAEILVQTFANWQWSADTTEWPKARMVELWRQDKRGAPVVVKPDGWKWGKEECPPQHIIIKLPGVPADSLMKYFIPLRDTTDELSLEVDMITKKFRAVAAEIIVRSFPDVFEAVGTSDPILSEPLEDVVNRVRQELPLTIDKGGILGIGTEEVPNPRIALMDSFLTAIPPPFEYPVSVYKPFLISKAVVDSALTLKDGKLELTKNQFEAIIVERELRPK